MHKLFSLFNDHRLLQLTYSENLNFCVFLLHNSEIWKKCIYKSCEHCSDVILLTLNRFLPAGITVVKKRLSI